MNPPLRTRLGLALGLALLTSAIGAARAEAARVALPIVVDHGAIAAELRFALFTQTDGSWRLADGSGCNVVRLYDPAVSSESGRLKVSARMRASLGAPVFDRCLPGGTWTGSVDVFEEPAVAQGRKALRFRVVDSALSGDGATGAIAGKVWGWVKPLVHARLEAFELDLAPQSDAIGELLPGVLRPADDAWMRSVVDSLAIESVAATERGLEIGAGLEIPARPVAPALPDGAPEPALTSAEHERWTEQWQAWDAFLTATVQRIFTDGDAERELGDALAQLLLDARHELDQALTGPPPGAGEDRVRALFVRAWSDLAPRLRSVATERGEAGLTRYLAFIAAGDALAALDQAAPEVGVEVSTDGMRRLIRVLMPDASEDPLIWSERIDPGFRDLVGLGAPIAPPSRVLPEPEPPAAPAPAPVTPAPAPTPRPAPPPAVARSLDRWSPTRDDLDVYLPRVRDVLVATADDVLAGKPLDERYHEVFRTSVLATAWKESCWRQFVTRDGKLVPLGSGAGAVGIMQINKRVWRGAYDVKALEWDLGYNAEAGAEILLHYLRDYALKKGEHERPGGVDNLPRAAYAVYNGGPRHLGRYRDAGTSASLKAIDAGFWERYSAVRAGRALDVRSCF